jgi:signal transduction histidine kinase
VVDTDVMPGGPGRRSAALVVGVLTCLVSATALVLALVNVGTPDPAFVVHREFFPTDLLIAAVYAPFGVFVVVRSGHVIGWALLLVGVGFSLTSFGIQYAVLGVEHPDLPAYAGVVQLVVSGWIVGVLTCVLVIPLLIGPRAPTGTRRALALAATAVAVSAGVVRYLIQVDGFPSNPLTAGTAVADAALAYDDWVIPIYFLLGLVAVGYLGARVRRSDAVERRPLGWVLASVAITTLSYLAFELGLSLGQPMLTVGAGTLAAAMLMLPVAIFVVVRGPSWDLDLAVSRATVGALLTLFVITAYVVLVWVGAHLLPVGRDSAGLLAVALLAVGIMPVRAWLQRRVERLVFGSTSDAGELLERLGADVGRTADERTVLEGLVEALRHSLRLATVVVEATEGGLRVAVGVPGDQLVAVVLRSRGQQIGTLWLGPPTGERLDLRTLELVKQISGLVAGALDLALVNADLERARGRLLDVRQEERRLLRRELHDSLGPSLAGISLALAGIDRTSTLTPPDSELLGQLQEELTHRAQDVRLMARALLPPALEEGRLGEALEALASRFSGPEFCVHVETERPDAIDSRRQVAIYHVAAEAVLNAHRHAGARRCTVRLERPDGERLCLTVTDDGHGLAESSGAGIGLRSMRERAVELGGTLEVTAPAIGGTTVRMVLPQSASSSRTRGTTSVP